MYLNVHYTYSPSYFFVCRGAVSAEAVPDSEEDVDEDTSEDSLPARARPDTPEYVQVVDPSATEITFVKTDCPERKVIKIVCDQLGMNFIYDTYCAS